MDDEIYCECCGALMKKYWHSLSRGLVDTFREFVTTVKRKGRNEIHLQEDMTMSNNEYNNFQKLRYWGLVHHADKENLKSGKWLVTRLGGQFIRGEIEIPKKVQTFRNRITDKSEETVKITDFYQYYDKEYWEREFDFNIYQSKLM